MTEPFFTVGYGTRTIDEFIALLKEAGVTVVVDVRTVPRSRTNPQFKADTLPASLATDQLAHRHLAALGGLRSRQRTVAAEATRSGTTKAFTTMPTIRWAKRFARRSRSCGNSARTDVAPSCGRKRCGGDVTAGSSRII
jgi:hypothetical protein